MTKASLEELVEGDKVVVSAGCHNDWIDTVVRITATQIVLTKGERYNRKSGYRCGESSGYGRQYLHLYTPQAAEAIERRKLISHLTSLRREQLEKLSTEALRHMKQLCTINELAKP